MDIQQAVARFLDDENLGSRDLSTNEMREVMMQIMTGNATDAQIGAFLVGLRIKGETVEEITGAAQVMRELADPVAVTGDHLVDIVGTGGDSAGIFNVSTASTFVAAAAGASVAKHGNRSVSSKSGSADLLESAGVRLDLTSEQVALCVEEVGVGFMFAVNHHSAMKHAIGPVSISIWDEPGLLIEGFQESPMVMMGHHPSEYQQMIEGAGYKPAKSLYTYDLDISGDFSPLIQRIVKSGERNDRIHVRMADLKNYERDVRILLEILKDMFYQCFVRRGKLSRAIKVRRFFVSEAGNDSVQSA